MKKIHQLLWENGPFKILVIFVSRLRDEVRSFDPIHFKLAHIASL